MPRWCMFDALMMGGKPGSADALSEVCGVIWMGALSCAGLLPLYISISFPRDWKRERVLAWVGRNNRGDVRKMG